MMVSHVVYVIYDLKTVPTLIDIAIGFESPEQNITEGPNSTVEVCFSSQQDSLMSSSVTLIVDISPTATSSGKSDCPILEICIQVLKCFSYNS